MALTEAEAGPAGSQVRAAAAPAEAATATVRRTDLDLNMGYSRCGVNGYLTLGTVGLGRNIYPLV
jgi:hypothetical protein